jgi:hypothetical protein
MAWPGGGCYKKRTNHSKRRPTMKRIALRLPDEVFYKSHSIEELEIDLRTLELELKRQRTVMRELQIEKQTIQDILMTKRLAVRRFAQELQ